MEVLSPRSTKKPAFPPGIGRGHSSLPPKPAFAGKPLPRDTDAIVLTSGGDAMSFPPSSKPKRTYSSVASDSIMRPMDPAVTNLTPQNTISPSASHHHQLLQSITPPAEAALATKPQVDHCNIPPVAPKARPPQVNGSIDGTLNNSNMGRPVFHSDHQQTPHMMGFNGLPDMYHPMGPHFMGPPPHHHPGYFPHPYHGGALTPPQTGNMFIQQPHMENMLYGEMLGGAGGDGTPMFPPGYVYQSNEQVIQQRFAQMSMHSQSPPPPAAAPPAPSANETRKASARGTLKGISFVVPEDDSRENTLGTRTPISAPGPGTPPGFNKQVHDKAQVEETRPRLEPPIPSITSLESYMANQFLSKKLSDVTLVLIHTDTHTTDVFHAHSFILGRSEKLCELLENGTVKPDAYGRGLVRTHPTTSWADEVEHEESVATSPPIQSNYADGMTTILFESPVTTESFLLALKTLYGASEWELDAFLDPSHPAYQSTPTLQGTSSQNVQMLERSIQIFAAGVLLGLDDVIFKAIDGIGRWGMRFEGGSFERLLKFLLEETEDMRRDKALISPHWNFTGQMLDDTVDMFARSIPEDFKLDFRAPNSRFLNRLGSNVSVPPSAIQTPPPGLHQPQRLTRQTLSTILVSLPFEVLKQTLEHTALSRSRKQLFELATSVVQERERRRKREMKAVLEQKTGSECGSQNGSEILTPDKNDLVSEVLFWEESAVSTFGHGGIGIEIAKRRKGGPGGRMLWKVGRSASTV